eukprot:scaffold4095_cov117-Cylindrotheca_fusiformis.AAC.24
MGWFHSLTPEEQEAFARDNAPTTCSIESRPPPAKREDASKKTDEVVPSGNTACPLPLSSPPPPPPPDAGSIYHLCQKSIWEEAVKAQQPYFPPTYMADGKFTRASLFKDDLVSTANTFYQDVPGAWIVLEIDCKALFGLGIPILSQDAPESTKTKPVRCLQVFGGVSTTFPGLVTKIYDMKRSSRSGKFLSISEASHDVQKEQALSADNAKSPTNEKAQKSNGKFRLFKKK